MVSMANVDKGRGSKISKVLYAFGRLYVKLKLIGVFQGSLCGGVQEGRRRVAQVQRGVQGAARHLRPQLGVARNSPLHFL